MDFYDLIDPFFLVEHEDRADVCLYIISGYKKELFISRKKDGFNGTGYDWESLAQAFIDEIMPEIKESIEFDSERGMFCAYSSDIEALKNFIVSFKNACEDNELIDRVFSNTKPDIPPSPSATDVLNMLTEMLGNLEIEK